MTPSTLLGLLLFAASIGPGYVYVRVAERHRPRPERSGLLETAELISIGGFASALALLAGLLIAKATRWIDLAALADEGTKYVLTRPGRGLTFGLAVLLASYVGTWAVAMIIHRKVPAAIFQYALWHRVFSDDERTRYVYATVELRDGRSVYGGVDYYTLDEDAPEHKELVLTQPLKVRASARGQWIELADDKVVLSARDITTIGITYRPIPTDVRKMADADPLAPSRTRPAL